MENNRKKENICFDQIEKIMQELDATNTEYNLSTQPATDLPHRPIILRPQIKDEPKDKDANHSHFETGAQPHQDNAATNNVLSTVATQISDNGPKDLSSSAGQFTQYQLQIKTESIEDHHDMSVGSSLKGTDRSECAIQNTQPTTSDSTPQIKSEPVEVNSLQNVNTTTPEQSTNNNSQEVPSETNMDSTAPNSPNALPDADETLPDNFFDDLIKDADSITAAALKSTALNEKEHAQVFLDVKSEPVDTTTTSATLEFNASNNITQENEATQVNLNVKNEPVDITAIPTGAPIPENFFDDLLVDHVAERVDEVVTKDLEIKYSERLKELQKLQAMEQDSHKAHKKHKKKKKKSHKRTHSENNEDEDSIIRNHKRNKHASRSRSKSPQSKRNSAEAQCVSSTNKSSGSLLTTGIRVKNEFTGNGDRPTEIVDLYAEEPETSASAARRMLCVKSELSTYQPVEKSSDICLPVKEIELFQRRSSINRNGLIVDMTAPLGFKRIKMESELEKSKTAEFASPKDKMENSKQRALAAIEEFNKGSKKLKDRSFIYTNTVRKLPNSTSYITQQTFDNRSPLHNVNNVLYKFNSHANQFNLHEWGIEEMSPKAREVAKILGFDIDALNKKKETIKLPPKIQKIKQEHMTQAKKKLTHRQTSSLITVSTQTDEATVLAATAKQRHNIAVQTESQGNYNGSHKYDELPLMRQISTFNENQLMALSDFADLICESALTADTNAMDLFRLRQRMMDIYKCAQLPSELAQKPQQVLRDPRQERINAMQVSPPPPAPRLLPQYAQPPISSTIPQHSRDPRQERALTMHESLPPTRPTAHPAVRPNEQRPLASLQQHTTWQLHPRTEPSAAVTQKVPIHLPSPIEPQQSYMPKYYGRGAMRR